MTTAVDTAEQICGRGRATGFGRREWAGRTSGSRVELAPFSGAIRKVVGVFG